MSLAGDALGEFRARETRPRLQAHACPRVNLIRRLKSDVDPLGTLTGLLISSVASRVAHTGFAVRGRNQLAQDAALVRLMMVSALGTQHRQLFFQCLQALDARTHALDLLIHQFVDVAAILRGQRREVQQAPDVGHGNVQCTTVPHEREAFQVPGSIAAVAIGQAVGQVDQARALVEPDRAHLDARGLAQVADLHPVPFIALCEHSS